MALRGNTQSFKLEELLQSLYTSLSSGTLSIAQGNASQKIYFNQGNIVLPTSRAERPWLGSLLVHRKLITENDLNISLQEQRILKFPLIDILVDKDVVTLEEVTAAVESKLMEELFEIFLWQEAFFEFKDEEFENILALKNTGHCVLNTNALIMEALRRNDEWSRIKTLLPSFGLLFEVKSSEEEAANELEKKLLKHYQSCKPTKTFFEDSIYSKFEICLATYQLLKDEKIRILSPEELKKIFDQALLEKKHARAILCLEAADESQDQNPKLISRMQISLFSDKDFIQETKTEYKISLKREKWELTNLFLTIFLKKHTGLLTIKDPLNTKLIYFDEKKIYIRTEGEIPGESFGHFLHSRKLITTQQYDMLNTHEKVREIPFETCIAEFGILDEVKVTNFLKEKILEEIAAIFLWPNPYCEFSKNHYPEIFAEKMQTTDSLLELKSSATLYKELVNDLTQWSELLEKISSNKVIFCRAQELKENQKLDQETHELLQFIDGRSSLQDIFDHSNKNQSPLKICRNLFQLLNKNIIRTLTVTELKSESERTLYENVPEECLKFCEYAFELGEEVEFFHSIQEKMRLKNIHFLDSTETYKLDGDLKSVNLAELFQSFHSAKQSGFFALRSGIKEFPLHFVKGNIYYQESSAFPLPPEQLKAREISGMRQLLEIFFWKDATFSFTKNFYLNSFNRPSPNTYTLKFATPEILMESLKMFEEWEEITKNIPSMFSIFVRLDNSVSSNDDAFLKFFRGYFNLNEILEKTGYENFTLCRQVDSYCQRGELGLLNKYDAYQFANQSLDKKNYALALKYYWHIQSLEPSNQEIKKIISLIQKQLEPNRVSDYFSGSWNMEQAQNFFLKLVEEFVSGTLEFTDGRKFYFSQDEMWVFSDDIDWVKEMKSYFLSHQILTEKQFQNAIHTKPPYLTILQNLVALQYLNKTQLISSACDLALSYLLKLFSEEVEGYTYKPRSFPYPCDIERAVSAKLKTVPMLHKILSICKNLPNEVQLSKLPQIVDLMAENLEEI